MNFLYKCFYKHTKKVKQIVNLNVYTNVKNKLQFLQVKNDKTNNCSDFVLFCWFIPHQKQNK